MKNESCGGLSRSMTYAVSRFAFGATHPSLGFEEDQGHEETRTCDSCALALVSYLAKFYITCWGIPLVSVSHEPTLT